MECVRIKSFARILIKLSLVILITGVANAQDITVVNMMPWEESEETWQDSEPNLAVNPANPLEIAASAFTPDPDGGVNAPIYISWDGGNTWALNPIVPSPAGITRDITLKFSLTNILYTAILRNPAAVGAGTTMDILRTNNFLGATAMTLLVTRDEPDQPYLQATTMFDASGTANDRVYVGNNDFGAAAGQTATIDLSPDAGTAPPPAGFNTFQIETRATAVQDGPPIRTAIHPDGTVYGIFYRRTARGAGGARTADIVVVRDDNWGVGAAPFTALVDPADGAAGRLVVTGITFRFVSPGLGQERIGDRATIAVDPRDSDIVYIAWADDQPQIIPPGPTNTLHVRRSTDRGITWSKDLLTKQSALNPALAVNSHGRVGFLYQRYTGGILTPFPGVPRWVTSLHLTDDGFETVNNIVLATVPANTPVRTFYPYIGDYIDLMALGTNFYGVFSANNTPNMANFPNGVIYQRNANFGTNTLLDLDNVTPVDPSIDPFFFSVKTVDGPLFGYAAKIVCGSQEDPEDMRLARGFYATTINIHNPNVSTVAFSKKLAWTFPPEAQRPGFVRTISAKDVLTAGRALKVDCVIIRERFKGTLDDLLRPYFEGFVIIQSRKSLDVTALYTAASLDGGGLAKNHSSIDVEQVRERLIEQPDLIIESLTYLPLDPTIADTITFTAVVRNVGTSSADPSFLALKVGGETFPGVFAIPTLEKGERFSVFRHLLLSVAQNYLVTATADVNDDVPESDGTNNQKTLAITVNSL